MSRYYRVFFYSLSILLLLLISLSDSLYPRKDIGFLCISPGNSSIYFEHYDLTIYAEDVGEITYFFLPAYIELSSLDYSKSDLIILSENGDLLQNPQMNTVESVVICDSSDNRIPYRVGFFRSENLCTIDVNLQDGEADSISREEYSDAMIKITSSGGEVGFFSEESYIKGRGNMPWDCEKKPYDIKLSGKASFGRLTPSDRWTLLANDLDPTNLRNKIAFDVADILKMEYVSESEWVDLYINGRYMGNYLACHEIRKSPRGGYLLEQNENSRVSKDRYTFKVSSGMSMTIKDPDSQGLSSGEKREIHQFVLETDRALHENMPEAQYDIIDRYSFARRYLVDEIMLNADMDLSSHFYYTRIGEGIMYAGPCWDYDKSLGYYRENRRDWTSTVLTVEPLCGDWDLRLTEDEEYEDYVAKTFGQYVNDLDNILCNKIDYYYDWINASTTMDRIRWRGTPRHIFEDDYNDVRYLKFFLYNRLQYLADEYDCKYVFSNPVPEEKINHKVTARFEDGQEELLWIPDGAWLDAIDLPDFDRDIHEGWYFNFYGQYEAVSGLIPIFEDVVVYLI